MNKTEVIEKVMQLNLPAGSYVVLGGGVLAIRRLRETKDVDILVSPLLFEQLSKIYPFDSVYEEKWNRKRLKVGEVEVYPDLYLEKENRYFDVEDVIKSAEFVDGVALQPIDNLIMCKLDSGREKDLHDVELIKQHLK